MYKLRNDSKILLDSDVIRHFIKGQQLQILYSLYGKHIIASSNLRDIKLYCEENKIAYITTMDILIDAMDKEKLTEIECNEFIKQVKERKSRLPVETIGEYKKMREHGYDS